MAPPKKHKASYSDEDMISALAAIKNGTSYRKASKEYNIPISTLSNKMTGHTQLGCSLGMLLNFKLFEIFIS